MSGTEPNLAGLYQSAVFFRDQGRIDLATDQLRRLLALDPENVDAHALYCMCECGNGRLDEADRWVEEGLRIDPNHAFTHYAKSIALYRRGKFAESFQCLTRRFGFIPSARPIGFASPPSRASESVRAMRSTRRNAAWNWTPNMSAAQACEPCLSPGFIAGTRLARRSFRRSLSIPRATMSTPPPAGSIISKDAS